MNNTYSTFPPLMSDGRNYSLLTPSNVADNKFKMDTGMSNYEYRQYLIKNANEIIKTNQLNACHNCSPCFFRTSDTSKNYISQKCKSEIDEYGFTDLKSSYLSKAELERKKHNPLI